MDTVRAAQLFDLQRRIAGIRQQGIDLLAQGAGLGEIAIISFASGTDVTFDNLGSDTAGTLGSIADLVDDPSVQISTVSILGLGAGSVLNSDPMTVAPVVFD